MIKIFRRAALLCGLMPFASMALAATCDQYPGDTWVYGGVTSSIKPNVLIIVDTSGSMSDSIPGTASAYNPATTYPKVNEACRNSSGNKTDCTSTRVYKLDPSNGRWSDAGFNLNSVTTACPGGSTTNPNNLLSTTGQYTGRTLSTAGACSTNTTTATYATGNWINWDKGGTSQVEKIVVAREVVKNLISSTTGVNFGVMLYNNGGGSNQTNAQSQSQGSRFFTYAASGTTNYTSTIKDMDAIFTGTMTNREALLASINTTTVVAQGYTPLAESLYEAGQYFRGGTTAFANTIGISGGKYISPITSSCQKNYIIFVTDGMSTSDDDPVLNSVCPSSRPNCQGDYDGDGMEPTNQSSGDNNSTTMWHAMDDVAKYLYDADLLADDTTVGKEYTIGKQNISTFTIGFGAVGANADAVALLQRTADQTHGHGASYLAGDQSGLTTALTQIMSSILSIDTSFVAPVVPVSPENRTYNSSRVYMGFFKPVNQTYWEGNLKKYGIDANNNIIDMNGNKAMWVDVNNDRIDDNSGESLPTGATNGTFRSTSVSWWSTVADAGDVNSGGAGDLLLARDFASNPRKIYTYYTGSTSTVLSDTVNAFTKTNNAITAALLGVADTASKDKLVDFIHGIDSYDENANGNATEKRGWLFGDILHSKPLVLNYATYTMSTANEADCSVNKSYIYVGSNDGMLHAIKDCNGSEAWAFMPPEVLGNLKEIPGQIHTYTVDSSPAVYIYDANKNGTIETSTDKVILMVGLRRGGGPNTAPARGSYYALDVSDPAAPKYLWSLSNSTTGFSELAESWAEPKIVKLKIGSTSKIAAIIGGGYDNMNEDSRYGHTQTFTGDGAVNNTASGSGNLTSSGTSAQSSPKGRAIYAVEMATLSSAGVPTIATEPTRIWGVVYGSATDYTTSPATDAGMTFAIAADMATLDTDGDGYADRMYAADLGGNLWRFDIGNPNAAAWRGYRIFSANPGSGGTADTGRKVFYKPAVTMEASISTASRGNDAYIMMGTGDREHPLNTAVVDRMYAIRDRGQTSPVSETSQTVPSFCTSGTVADLNLLDVTSNQLQSTTVDNSSSNPNSPTAGSVEYYLNILLKKCTNFGWYIKLDQNAGEKVLASPTLFSGVAHFTTFTPGSSSNVDPCKPSNLGTSRIYALNYLTGEAVLNYDKTNDTVTTTNKRANVGTTANPVVLARTDRVKTLGSGIPSGVVLIINPGGGIKALIGSSGSILPEDVKKGGSIINLYWGQK